MAEWKNKHEFRRKVRYYAKKIGIDVKALYIRPMRKKWASCSTNGNLNFNSELLKLNKEIGEYVIVHELLHFHVPNHSKLWKSLMTANLGNYKNIELKLKEKSRYLV